MKQRGTIKIIFCYFLAVLLIQCNGSSDSQNIAASNEENQEDIATTSIEIDTNEYEFMFIPPSPIQIASILRKANMPYEEGLTNPTANAETYSTQFKQSLNFGVYACDLAYCVTNDK